MKIGFIGQGFVGKSYADDYESRGFTVVRYSLEAPYVTNREYIRECDVVVIAVPTPTTPAGVDFTALNDALACVGEGMTAVIKSTIPPGTTQKLQRAFPHITLMHAPEFLSNATAAYEAAHPNRNILGIVNEGDRKRAEEVLATFAPAPYSLICTAEEAECIKYARNIVGVFRILFYNLLYDISEKHGASWDRIADAIAHDPDNGPLYTRPVHKNGRGAGGMCFIKDLAAFIQTYETLFPDDHSGNALLRAIETKNIELLLTSKKDLTLLSATYGTNILE